jgi:hypothetical protein
MEMDAKRAREKKREQERLLAYKPKQKAVALQWEREHLQSLREQTSSIKNELEMERELERERKELVTLLKRQREDKLTMTERRKRGERS